MAFWWPRRSQLEGRLRKPWQPLSRLVPKARKNQNISLHLINLRSKNQTSLTFINRRQNCIFPLDIFLGHLFLKAGFTNLAWNIGRFFGPLIFKKRRSLSYSSFLMHLKLYFLNTKRKWYFLRARFSNSGVLKYQLKPFLNLLGEYFVKPTSRKRGPKPSIYRRNFSYRKTSIYERDRVFWY